MKHYAPPIMCRDPYSAVDDWDDRRDLDEADAHAEAVARAYADIQTYEWWSVALEGIPSAERAAAALAACMKELDAACDGDTLALTAITTALSRLQRDALRDAEEWARG